jgi:cysteine desulfurase
LEIKAYPTIYLDNNATTKTDDRVIDLMLSIMKDFYANPSSSHSAGKKVGQLVDDARTKTAALINCDDNEVVFTSGATEGINLALRGMALSHHFNRKKIVTVSTEHKAVLDTCKALEDIGFEVVYLPVNADGTIDLELYAKSIDSDTLFVAAMLVNNETGVQHEIRAMVEVAHKNGALFFCDATQGVGKIEVDVNHLEVDMLCFSGHKFHGPKGVGALYINNSIKHKIQPQQTGGGQEFGIRSGTSNTTGIVGLGEASKIASMEMREIEVKVKKLRDQLEAELLKIPGAFINGDKERRIYNTSNICFPNNDANVIIGRLKNIAISNGSACTSSIVEPSHVLDEMGLDSDLALASLRFSLSKYNTIAEIERVIQEMRNILIRNVVSN